MNGLKTTVKNQIIEATIKNLLSAQKRIAEEGDAVSLIRVSKYLLQLAEKFGNVLVEVSPERDE